MSNYWLGVIGTWLLADAIYSLFTYTTGAKAAGQRWWYDHSIRILRGLLGIVLVVIGWLW